MPRGDLPRPVRSSIRSRICLLALCLLVVSRALPSQDLRRAESGRSQEAIPIQKAWSALDSKSLSRQHEALRLLARNAGCLSRPEVDRWTRKAISVLGTGEKGLVKAVLKVCARQPYGPGNPDADTWGRVLASLAKGSGNHQQQP